MEDARRARSGGLRLSNPPPQQNKTKQNKTKQHKTKTKTNKKIFVFVCIFVYFIGRLYNEEDSLVF